MIDLMQTRIGETLKKTVLLSDAIAWIELFTPKLKAQILREWIQDEQLTQLGVDENGEIIGFYSYASEIASGGIKQEGSHYTLEDTGDFYKSMFIIVTAKAFFIDADYAKMEDQDWWREEILGLTDESLTKLIEEAKVHYIEFIRSILGIN